MFNAAILYISEGAACGTLLTLCGVRLSRHLKNKGIPQNFQVVPQEIVPRDVTSLTNVPAQNAVLGRKNNYFILGPPEKPLITLTAKDVDYASPHAQQSPSILSSRMIAMLQPTVNLINDVRHVSTKTIELVFAPEILQRLNDGTASLMLASQEGFRANAINATGQVVGQGWLKCVTQVDYSQVAMSVWSVLTIVTSQHHLAGIDKRLKGIENTLGEIKEWLRDAEFARTLGNYDYLTSIYSTVSQHRYEQVQVSALDNQIEQVYRETCHVLPLLDSQMDSYTTKVKEQTLKGKGFDEHKSALKDLIVDFAQFAHFYVAALQVAAMTAQMRCALPIDRHLSEKRLGDLLLRMKEHSQRIADFEQQVQYRLPELTDAFENTPGLNKLPAFKSPERHDEDREEVLKSLLEVCTPVRQELDDLHEMVQGSHNRLVSTTGDSAQPVKLLITLNKAREITDVRQVAAP